MAENNIPDTAAAEKAKPWKTKAIDALRRQGQLLQLLTNLPDLKLTPAAQAKAKEVCDMHGELVKAFENRLNTLSDTFVPAGVRNRSGLEVGDKVKLAPGYAAVYPAIGDKTGTIASIRTLGEGRGNATKKFAQVKVGNSEITVRLAELAPV